MSMPDIGTPPSVCADRILRQDRTLGNRLGYAISPWLRGAAAWLAVALAYDVVTGQFGFLPWHSVKGRWDTLIHASWWRDVRHLIRGLPEGVALGIVKARGKNPIKRRDRAQYRRAPPPPRIDSVQTKIGLALLNTLAAIVTLAVTLVGGYGFVRWANTGPAVLAPVEHAYWRIADAVTWLTPGLPSTIRDAFSLANLNENVGRIAGFSSHAAGRLFTRQARKDRFELMVQTYVKQIRSGDLERSRPWSGEGAAIHEAAERVALGVA
ncbi:MAG TPA: hypothetical protein VF221_23675 [Chloroflexota bacterium]